MTKNYFRDALYCFQKEKEKKFTIFKKRRDRLLLFIDYDVTKTSLMSRTLMFNILLRLLGYPFRFLNGAIVGHLMLGKTDRFPKSIFTFYEDTQTQNVKSSKLIIE